MVKMECFLPYLIMIVILIFLVYDIFSILKRERFKVVLVDKESGCFSSDPDVGRMKFIEVDGDKDSDYIRFLLNQGMFPNYTRDGEEINGGLPQTGNLSWHLEKFKQDVEGLLRRPEWQNYTGIISIIMNYWHHDWNMNYGALKIYQDKSVNLSEIINGQLNDLQMTEQIKEKAQEMFEKSARNFLLETLKQGKAVIPNARWGLSGSPVCTNCESCSSSDNNSGSDWLFSTSDVAFPELELHKNGSKMEKISKCIESNSKIKSKYKIKVFLNTKLTYHGEQEFIDKNHLKFLSEIFAQTKNLGYDGIIISIINNSRNRKFCDDLNDSFQGLLGKTIKELTDDWSWE